MSFNGAALFQSGERPLLPSPCSTPGACASMGPLFFRAENGWRVRVANRFNKRFNGAALFQSGEQNCDVAHGRLFN